MNMFIKKYQGLKMLFLVLGLCFSTILSAHGGFHGGGGGYHGGGWGGHGGYGHHGGYGWGGGTVIINGGGYYGGGYYGGGYYPPYYYDDEPDCRIVQQCYPDGDCIQQSVCD